jgi:hypothetical protein
MHPASSCLLYSELHSAAETRRLYGIAGRPERIASDGKVAFSKSCSRLQCGLCNLPPLWNLHSSSPANVLRPLAFSFGSRLRCLASLDQLIAASVVAPT